MAERDVFVLDEVVHYGDAIHAADTGLLEAALFALAVAALNTMIRTTKPISVRVA